MKTIKLNESKLRDIIKESIKQVLREQQELSFEQTDNLFLKVREAKATFLELQKYGILDEIGLQEADFLNNIFSVLNKLDKCLGRKREEAKNQNADWSHDPDAIGHDEDGHVDPNMGLDF